MMPMVRSGARVPWGELEVSWEFSVGSGARTAINHSLPRRIGPRTAEGGSARTVSADFHSLATPLAIAASAAGALSTW